MRAADQERLARQAIRKQQVETRSGKRSGDEVANSEDARLEINSLIAGMARHFGQSTPQQPRCIRRCDFARQSAMFALAAIELVALPLLAAVQGRIIRQIMQPEESALPVVLRHKMHAVAGRMIAPSHRRQWPFDDVHWPHPVSARTYNLIHGCQFRGIG